MCRCDERLTGKTEWSTRLVYTGLPWGTTTPKDREEVNKLNVSECDGWVCDFDTTGTSLIFKIIRSVTVLARILTIFYFMWEENVARWCMFYFIFILLWIKKVRAKDKTYIWGSIWWNTQKLKPRTLHVSHALGCVIPAVIHTYRRQFRRGRQCLPGCVVRTDVVVYMSERGGGRRGRYTLRNDISVVIHT